MSAGVNKVILLGNLGADPDLRYTPSGQAVCDLRLATHETWNDKNGQRQERTEWHRVVVWGARAEVCQKYLAKGRQVFIEGKIQTRSWDDKEGVKRWMTEVIANNVQFLGSGGDQRQGEQGGDRRQGAQGSDDRGSTAPPSHDDFGQDRGSYDRGGNDRGGNDRGGYGTYGRREATPDDDIPF